MSYSSNLEEGSHLSFGVKSFHICITSSQNCDFSILFSEFWNYSLKASIMFHKKLDSFQFFPFFPHMLFFLFALRFLNPDEIHNISGASLTNKFGCETKENTEFTQSAPNDIYVNCDNANNGVTCRNCIFTNIDCTVLMYIRYGAFCKLRNITINRGKATTINCITVEAVKDKPIGTICEIIDLYITDFLITGRSDAYSGLLFLESQNIDLQNYHAIYTNPANSRPGLYVSAQTNESCNIQNINCYNMTTYGTSKAISAITILPSCRLTLSGTYFENCMIGSNSLEYFYVKGGYDSAIRNLTFKNYNKPTQAFIKIDIPVSDNKEFIFDGFHFEDITNDYASGTAGINLVNKDSYTTISMNDCSFIQCIGSEKGPFYIDSTFTSLTSFSCLKSNIIGKTGRSNTNSENVHGFIIEKDIELLFEDCIFNKLNSNLDGLFLFRQISNKDIAFYNCTIINSEHYNCISVHADNFIGKVILGIKWDKCTILGSPKRFISSNKYSNLEILNSCFENNQLFTNVNSFNIFEVSNIENSHISIENSSFSNLNTKNGNVLTLSGINSHISIDNSTFFNVQTNDGCFILTTGVNINIDGCIFTEKNFIRQNEVSQVEYHLHITNSSLTNLIASGSTVFLASMIYTTSKEIIFENLTVRHDDSGTAPNLICTNDKPVSLIVRNLRTYNMRTLKQSPNLASALNFSVPNGEFIIEDCIIESCLSVDHSHPYFYVRGTKNSVIRNITFKTNSVNKELIKIDIPVSDNKEFIFDGFHFEDITNDYASGTAGINLVNKDSYTTISMNDCSFIQCINSDKGPFYIDSTFTSLTLFSCFNTSIIGKTERNTANNNQNVHGFNIQKNIELHFENCKFEKIINNDHGVFKLDAVTNKRFSLLSCSISSCQVVSLLYFTINGYNGQILFDNVIVNSIKILANYRLLGSQNINIFTIRDSIFQDFIMDSSVTSYNGLDMRAENSIIEMDNLTVKNYQISSGALLYFDYTNVNIHNSNFDTISSLFGVLQNYIENYKYSLHISSTTFTNFKVTHEDERYISLIHATGQQATIENVHIRYSDEAISNPVIYTEEKVTTMLITNLSTYNIKCKSSRPALEFIGSTDCNIIIEDCYFENCLQGDQSITYCNIKTNGASTFQNITFKNYHSNDELVKIEVALSETQKYYFENWNFINCNSAYDKGAIGVLLANPSFDSYHFEGCSFIGCYGENGIYKLLSNTTLNSLTFSHCYFECSISAIDTNHGIIIEKDMISISIKDCEFHHFKKRGSILFDFESIRTGTFLFENNNISNFKGGVILNLHNFVEKIEIAECNFENVIIDSNNMDSSNLFNFQSAPNIEFSKCLMNDINFEQAKSDQILDDHITNQITIFSSPKNDAAFLLSNVSFNNIEVESIYSCENTVSFISENCSFSHIIGQIIHIIIPESESESKSKDIQIHIISTQFINTNSEGAIYHISNQNEKFILEDCLFDQCSGPNYFCFYLQFSTFESFEFHNIAIQNIHFQEETISSTSNIYSSYLSIKDPNHQEIVFQKLHFQNNEGNYLYGGGIGFYIEGLQSMTFEECLFHDNYQGQSLSERPLPYGFQTAENENENNIESTPNKYNSGDGGAIQIGYSKETSNVALKFISCNFTNNQAFRHGGALAIQTLQNVLIENCIFENNQAHIIKSENYFDHNGNNNIHFFHENIYENSNLGYGGAIYIDPLFDYEDLSAPQRMKEAIISNCQFLDNKADEGNCIYIHSSTADIPFKLINNIFIDGESQIGSIIYSDTHNVLFLDDNTFNIFDGVSKIKYRYELPTET
ncbi:hypothetical protein TRFO_14262 [Tritrichomonas foetus]|uniref:Right handed beta helix domain-containing protein n=1 Tax=Tritrichomonas foetus TaxID=1144522 RepID=A0A1J4KVH1_9EUKA|nr:hypothetical protein TRFO_14262 [Tritrichomonas foetus]|eukprot:OHT15235.1 hypothetical protein TRFO_14262 [Tritrichomonas foetus]